MSAGLSLSAARADNFYHPPDWDPRKESLDQHHGSHPLRERARKLDQGILVIRFEMPFNVWCDGCGDLIGKGVRFNAEKKQTGSYLSTRIWSFSMHHHCGCCIVVRTDPKSCEYIVESGAKRKDEEFTAADVGTTELPDDEEKKRLAMDPFYRLEHKTARSGRLKDATEQVADLIDFSAARRAAGNDVRLNRDLKRDNRCRRKAEKEREKRAREIGLAGHLTLMPDTEAEAAADGKAFAAHRCRHSSQPSRKAIMEQDIFSSSKGMTSGKTSSSKPPRGRSKSLPSALAHSRGSGLGAVAKKFKR